MRIEVLGSGGAVTTPRPGCHCQVCAEARAKGVPYSRSGPSYFIHGPNILIDTPEESNFQLNRAQIDRVSACFYSHWHPDHVMGRRVWESLNADFLNWPPQHRRTDIYLLEQVARDFRTFLGSWEQFDFMQKQGYVRVIELTDSQVVTIGEVRVSPLRLAEAYVYAFLFKQGGQRVLIAPDELFGWTPPPELIDLDLAIIPMGLAEFHPLTGDRIIPADHPVLKSEATFQQTLEIVRQLAPRRTIMSHIEEPIGLSYDDLNNLSEKLKSDGFNIDFAYDTMIIE
jgi:phosphoribosyl 1,2-cyclic phosphate phosphodiesterase